MKKLILVLCIVMAGQAYGQTDLQKKHDQPHFAYVAGARTIMYKTYMLGREVKTLVNTTQDAGFKSVIWDATNDYGKPVSAGVYLYQIQAGKYISTKKMVLLK